MKMLRKRLPAIIISIAALFAIILIGPADYFIHGYFCDEIDCTQIAAEDFAGSINLENNDYTMTFMPEKDHMAGIEIYLINQPDGNTGNLTLTISDKSDNDVDKADVDLANVKAATWYKVYTKAKLKKGEEYTLRFSVTENCTNIPYLQNVDSDYLPDETTSGNVLLCYAYSDSTFTFQDKVLISTFIVTIWLFLVSFSIPEEKRSRIRYMACFTLITSILSWNYMYNSMDNQNTDFSTFQTDSESLVTGVIYAEEDEEYFRNDLEHGFGLGIYYDLKGCLMNYGLNYITDDNWFNGYSRSESAIVVNSNAYSKEVAVVGNQIIFKNGEQYQIISINDDGTNITIHLNSGKILSSTKNGSLDDAIFLDSSGNLLHKSLITAYTSQYGLQGKVFRHLARYINDEQELATLNLLCCLATAMVFAAIILLLTQKHNKLMAGCFFVTFWLSPWIVNFARNLYWVEFTWFIPMTIGLFCSWKIDNRKCRVASYVATFIATAGKCLCGYEYISVVMMGSIAFMLVDFLGAAINKEKKKAGLLFRTVVITGLAALAGFALAICIHAPLKGDGSIIEGTKNIFEQDVLRRVSGADLNNFGEEHWPSFNASVWEVYCRYFHFSTEVITGVAGNLFPLLCIIPLTVFIYEYKAKKFDVQLFVMYMVFFLTAISWFVLAKSHSYIHTHMNYVLWYFGFVQICFYIIISKVVSCFKRTATIKGELR